jgi:hypothetical protein
MKTAYSYVRLSSRRQVAGSGAERQLSRPSAICKQHGWTLSKQTFQDLGVSAFTGENRLKGDLSAFIQLAKEKRLAKHPVLILEAFDRFSRQDIDASEPVLLDLLKSGVDIHVAFSGKTFTSESTKSLADRIEILVALKSAYEYSANLSKRISAAKQKKLTLLRAGEIVPHNNVPKYLSYDKATKTYKHNANTEFVKRLVKDYLSGNSLYAISKAFNREKIRTFRRGFEWSAKSVRCILSNRILIGEYLGNKKFCEPIIGTEDFEKVQEMLAKHKHYNNKGRTGFLVNVFRGLAFCSACEKAMHMCNQSKNYRTGKPMPEPYRYLRCPSHSTGKTCSNWQHVKIGEWEQEFFMEFLMKTPEVLIAGNDSEARRIKREIGILDARKREIGEQIERLAQAIKDYNFDQFKRRADKLKIENSKVQEQLDALSNELRRVQGAPVDITNLKQIVAGPKFDLWKYEQQLRKVQESLKDNEVRKQIRLLLPSLFGRMVCYTQAGGHGNGAFEVLDRQGKILYRSLSFAGQSTEQ